jgi:hypothetical protein
VWQELDTGNTGFEGLVEDFWIPEVGGYAGVNGEREAERWERISSHSVHEA